MDHSIDPKKAILDAVGDISQIKVSGAQVLIGTYIRPEKTASGLILTDRTREEDEYQGKVGLVLIKGPLAFLEDENHDFGGFAIEVGDWVFYRARDGFSMKVNGHHCRLVEDIHVRGHIEKPDIVL